MRNVELVKYPKAQVLDEVVDRRWPMIKTRARGQYLSSGPCEAQHVFQVNGIVRRLARDQHELAAFFETDVGRTMNEICAGA